MPVVKRSRAEVEIVSVKLSAGEYLQYVIVRPRTKLGFSLVDTGTNEIILSHAVSPTLMAPPTYTRLWPVVGEWAPRESTIVLSLNFDSGREQTTFQVQHRRSDGSWQALIDVDFQASEPGDSARYSFRVFVD